MSTVTLSRAKEIMLYFSENGEEKTLHRYKISHDTLERYRRKIKHYSTRPPKILLFDIETAPMVSYTWGMWKQNIGLNQIIEDWCVISWAAKWLYASDIMGDVVTPKEILKRDDKRVCKSIWKLFEEADVVIAHNGDKFDIRKLNSRFFIHRMKPTSPYRSIDTLTQSRRNFAHTSHKLDYISHLVSKKGKLATDFTLWDRCCRGDKEALEYMFKYNKEDTLILEEVFVQIAPWMKSAPNMALYYESEEAVCASVACGSDDLTDCGDYYTGVARYTSYRCNKCGAIMRSRKSNVSKEEKSALLSTIAR